MSPYRKTPGNPPKPYCFGLSGPRTVGRGRPRLLGVAQLDRIDNDVEGVEGTGAPQGEQAVKSCRVVESTTTVQCADSISAGPGEGQLSQGSWHLETGYIAHADQMARPLPPVVKNEQIVGGFDFHVVLIRGILASEKKMTGRLDGAVSACCDGERATTGDEHARHS
ncbi:hypothetical protein LY78DRAFT_730808 [Colletotrichum sublineola]|nr:hypothetical protein LY78DRAFT_730808 [Colletotrichum sublineola]